MHARGIEHHSHGVENCLSTINIVLASGRIGRPYCAYGTVVGQGNGQGGREHGQKAEGLLSICFNPKVSLPDNAFVTRALEKLEFFTVIDFFLSETAQHADIVLPGSLHEEDEGVVCQVEGRVIKINKAVDPPGDARQDWRVIQDIARSLSRGSRRLLRHHLREDRSAERSLLAMSVRRPSRYAAPVRARFVEPDCKRRRTLLLL